MGILLAMALYGTIAYNINRVELIPKEPKEEIKFTDFYRDYTGKLDVRPNPKLGSKWNRE